MSIRKFDAAGCQTIEVRSLHARMVIQRRDVIVQIINGDEQDIWLNVFGTHDTTKNTNTQNSDDSKIH